MKKFIIILGFQFFILQVWAQHKLVQNQEPSQNAVINASNFVLPFQKYIFNNNLTLILNEDHSDPVVSLQFMFRIGAAASPSDMTGMVNLIAKLLYGDENAEDLAIINKFGGNVKLRLTHDYLSYQVNIPKNVYQLVYWYQSKKIVEFLSNVNQEMFLKAKENAIREATDSLSKHENAGLVNAIRSFYPFGHPYSWPIYGFPKHYEVIELNDLKKFYNDWMGANNLIVTVSGDISTSEVLVLTEKYLSAMPKAINQPEKVESAVYLTGNVNDPKAKDNRYISYIIEDENFNTPVLYMVYPGAAYSGNERIPLDFAAYSLGNIHDGILNKALVDNYMAEKVEVTNYSYKAGGHFIIKVVAKQNFSLNVLKDTIDYFVKNTFSVIEKGEGKKFKEQQQNYNADGTIADFNPEETKLNMVLALPVYANRKIIQLFSGIETSSRKACLLSNFELYMNNPDYIKQEFNNLFEFNPQKVIKSCNEKLALSRPLILSLLPIEQSKLKPAPDNYSAYDLQTVITHVTDDEISKIPVNKISPTKPKVGKTVAFNLPGRDVKVLENGLKFSTSVNVESPVLNIIIAIDISAVRKVAPIIEAPKLFVALIKNRFETAMGGTIKQQLDLAGASFDVSSQNDILYLRFEVMAENIQFLREIIRELLMNQVMMPVDIEKIQAKSLGSKITDLSEVFQNMIYIHKNPGGDLQTREFTEWNHYFSYYLLQINEKLPFILRPENTSVTIFGNFREGEVADFRENFRQWHALTSPDFNGNIEVSDTTNIPSATYFINKKIAGDPQLFILPAIIEKNNITDKIKMDFLKYLQADMANSLISKTLDGKSYFGNITSSYAQDNKNYYYYLTAPVKDESFIIGLKEIDQAILSPEISNIDKKAFKNLKNEFISLDYLKYEKNVCKAMFTNNSVSVDLPADYFSIKAKILKKLKPGSLKTFSIKNFSIDKKVIIVDGNAQKHITELSTAGYLPLIEINRNGLKVETNK